MDWHEAFKGLSSELPAVAVEHEDEERRGLFGRLRENLGKAGGALREHFRTILFDGITDELWEQIEEALIFADVGVEATVRIVEQLEREAADENLTSRDELLGRLSEIVARLLSPDDPDERLIDVSQQPSVILVVGVNGTGKTTTIGKLAFRLAELGKTPLMVAADTFRAAAVEQLSEWASRVGCEIVRQAPGSDPAAVVYDGIAAARSRGAAVVIVDTAGRLHTQVNLMNELAKVRRVIEQADPGGAARDPAGDRRHDGPERPAAGAGVRRVRRGHRRRAHSNTWLCRCFVRRPLLVSIERNVVCNWRPARYRRKSWL